MPELPAVFIPAQPLAAGQPRGQRGSVATVAVAAIYKFRGEEGGIQFYGFYDQNLGTFVYLKLGIIIPPTSSNSLLSPAPVVTAAALKLQ